MTEEPGPPPPLEVLVWLLWRNGDFLLGLLTGIALAALYASLRHS